MKFYRIFKILSAFFFWCAVLVLCIRGYLGQHFFASQQNFDPPAGQFVAPEKTDFHFAVVADTGSQNRTLQSILRQIVPQQPAFILHLGDLVTYRTQEHMYWLTDELDDKLHQIPMYLIPGNHDVKTKQGVINKSNYRRVFGPTYYWFGYGNTMFIALDSSELVISEAEWMFYETIMKKIRPLFKHVVLYTHVPPINPEGAPAHHLSDESVKKMAIMIKKYPPDLILTGHVHYYSKQEYMGVPLYSVPPSGQYFVGPVRQFGYLNVYVKKHKIDVQNNYVDKPRESELLDILFVNIFLGDQVRWIMGICLGLSGLMFLIYLILKYRIKSKASK